MRIPILTAIILIVGSLLVDAYLFVNLRRRCKSKLPSVLEGLSAVVMVGMLIVAIAMPRRSGDDGTLRCIMWMLFSFISVYFPKFLAMLFDLIASLPKLWHKPRWRFLTRAGVVLSVLLFIGLWWGALINRNNMQVKEVNVTIPELPVPFEGYRIVQISDLHVGTFGNDTAFVSRFVDRVNSLHPDLIVFTGDIVNRHTPELIPFVPVLSRLRASDGVVSILGNHDYGDYFVWPDSVAKQQNMEMLVRLQDEMGWDLLLNEHRWLKAKGDSIALIGVENVGDPPFHTYGSLPRAYATPGDSVVKILLSHNPAHWVNDIARNDTMNIALTLAGHTHAMQVELLGVSPAAMRYETWGGLYDDGSARRRLYVNIGAGTVGIPMRLGATPEITVITLRGNR